MPDLELLHRLALALAIGLLIGLERSWAVRSQREGSNIAGIRSFGLIALLGALCALLGQEYGFSLLGMGFLGLTVLVIVAHWLETLESRDYGITTIVAALLTYILGATVMLGEAVAAIVVAVVTTILLGLKHTLHGWIEKLQPNELRAILQLLLISIVMLPVIPDQGYGPWQALNPYEIWWMVVLIASISFIGYFAVKIIGTSRGILLTAMSGGLVASTAVALNFSRLGRLHPENQGLLAAGVTAASATMFPRILVVSSLIQPELLPIMAWPLGLMTAVAYACAWLLWRSSTTSGHSPSLQLKNPFDLLVALQFGGLLALVMLLAQALKYWFGNAGIYLLAAFSGISDVDAITMSLARMSPEQLSLTVAASGIFIAAIVNTLVKAGLVIGLCGGLMGRRIGVCFALTILAGLAGLGITIRIS